MRGSVDSRVVEMKFDNKDFMDKISETIAALEKMNEQIAAINGTHGLDNLTSHMNTFDLSNVANGVDKIKDRFSTLGIVGMTVIQRLTNAGIDMVMNIGNGFRSILNQIESGGKQRALNLEQAKFRLEGVLGSAEKVNAVMSDVDEAVKGTAYGLDEAAVSASMFAATGVEAGDAMFTVLRATAGIASTFGTDFQTISNIMVDTAAAGHLTNDALTRLTMQGVPAMQILQKEFDKTSEEIQKMATNGEISFNEFAKLMDTAYGRHAQDANKMFQGALANTRTALSRLGAKFYEPAFKFGIDIFNEFREDINAFSSGVDGAAKSFSVFGKYFTESFVGSLKSLRESGVFENIGKGMSNIVSAFMGWRGILRTVKDAFVEVFPSVTVENIGNISKKFLDLTKRFKELSNNTIFLEKLKNVIEGILNLFKFAFNIVSGVAKVLFSLIKVITGLTGKTVDLSEVFFNFTKVLSNLSGAVGIFDFLASAIDGAGKVIGKAFDTIFGGLQKFVSSISKSIGGIENVNGALTALGIIWAGLFGGQLLGKATFFGTKILQLFTGVKDVINTFMRTAATFPEKFNTLMTTLTNSLKNMTAEVQSKAIKNIALSVLALAIALKIISELDNEEIARGLSGVTVILGEMAAVMAVLTKMAGGEFSKSMKGIYAIGSMTTSMIKIGAAMVLMAVALKMIAELDPKQMATGLTGLTIMLGAVLGFVLALDKFQTMKADTKVGTTLMGVAVALLIMAKAIQTMSSLKPSELAKGLAGVVVILTAIFGFIAASSKMGLKSSAGLIAAGVGMIAIATAINILAPALQKLGSLSLDQLAKGLSAMALAMVTMAATSQYMNAAGAAGMLIMAMAISAIGTAIERIGSLDILTIAKGLGTIIVAIAALGAASAILAPVIPVMLALGGAMMLVSASIAVFGAGLMMIGAGLVSISAGIMSFASVTSTSLGIFINTMKMVLQELISLLPSLAASLAESFVTFLEQIAELAPRLKDALTKLIMTALEAVDENAPRIIKTGIRLILNFLSGLEEAMPRITKKAIGVVTGFIDGVAEKIPDIVDSGWNLIISFIDGIAQGIEDHTEELKTAIDNLCLAILDAFMTFFGIHSPSTVMADQGENLILGLLKGIGRRVGEVPEKILSSLKNLPANIAKKASGLISTGKTIMKNFLSGIGDKKKEIKEKFTKGLEEAKTKIKNSKMYDLGKNLMQGFLNGLNSLKDKVGEFWTWLCDKAESIIKKKNDIRSPSKKYYKFGSYIMQGLINGLNEYKDKPSKILANVSDAMNDALIKTYDAIDSDGNFNPTITPVLDLSDVRKEAGNIDSILGNNSISAAYSAQSASDIYQANNTNKLIEMLSSQIGKLTESNNSAVPMTNNFNISGAENPEDFANRFLRQLQIEMRAG